MTTMKAAAWAAADRLFPASLASSPPPRTELSEADLALVAKASEVLSGAERRLVAMVRAAHQRWHPGQSVYNADETGPPVFSDEEFSRFLGLVERAGEVALTREVCCFLGLPNDLVDSVTLDLLRTRLLGSSPSKSGGNVVMRQTKAPND